jgi:hypothetical protein
MPSRHPHTETRQREPCGRTAGSPRHNRYPRQLAARAVECAIPVPAIRWSFDHIQTTRRKSRRPKGRKPRPESGGPRGNKQRNNPETGYVRASRRTVHEHRPQVLYRFRDATRLGAAHASENRCRSPFRHSARRSAAVFPQRSHGSPELFGYRNRKHVRPP